MPAYAIESPTKPIMRNQLPSPASFRGPEARTLMRLRGRNLAWEHVGSRDRPNRNLTALTTAQMGACEGLWPSQKSAQEGLWPDVLWMFKRKGCASKCFNRKFRFEAREGLWPERQSSINHPFRKKLSPFHLQIQKIKRTLQYKVKLWTPTKPHPHSTR